MQKGSVLEISAAGAPGGALGVRQSAPVNASQQASAEEANLLRGITFPGLQELYIAPSVLADPVPGAQRGRMCSRTKNGGFSVTCCNVFKVALWLLATAAVGVALNHFYNFNTAIIGVGGMMALGLVLALVSTCRKYKILKAERAALDLTVAQHRIGTGSDQNHLRNVRQNMVQDRRRIAQLENSVAGLNADVTNLERQIRSESDQSASVMQILRDDRNKIEQERQQLEARCTNLQQRVDKLSTDALRADTKQGEKDDVAQVRKERERLDQEVIRLSSELDALKVRYKAESEAQKSTVDAHKTSQEALKRVHQQKIAALEAQVREANAAVEAQRQKLADAPKHDSMGYQDTIATQVAQLAQVRDENRQLIADHAIILDRAKTEASKAAEERIAQEQALRSQLQTQMQDGLQSKQAELDALLQQLNDSKEKFGKLRLAKDLQISSAKQSILAAETKATEAAVAIKAQLQSKEAELEAMKTKLSENALQAAQLAQLQQQLDTANKTSEEAQGAVRRLEEDLKSRDQQIDTLNGRVKSSSMFENEPEPVVVATEEERKSLEAKTAEFSAVVDTLENQSAKKFLKRLSKDKDGNKIPVKQIAKVENGYEIEFASTVIMHWKDDALAVGLDHNGSTNGALIQFSRKIQLHIDSKANKVFLTGNFYFIQRNSLLDPATCRKATYLAFGEKQTNFVWDRERLYNSVEVEALIAKAITYAEAEKPVEQEVNPVTASTHQAQAAGSIKSGLKLTPNTEAAMRILAGIVGLGAPTTPGSKRLSTSAVASPATPSTAGALAASFAAAAGRKPSQVKAAIAAGSPAPATPAAKAAASAAASPAPAAKAGANPETPAAAVPK